MQVYLKPKTSPRSSLQSNKRCSTVQLSKNALNTPLTIQTFDETLPFKKKSDYIIQSTPDCGFRGF